MNINLNIEQIVLHGFAYVDRDAIAAALQQELARLFAEQGLPLALGVSGQINRVQGGSFAITPDMQVEAIGSQIAQAIYQSFGRSA
jgi:uncharacterized membrane-anchored protein